MRDNEGAGTVAGIGGARRLEDAAHGLATYIYKVLDKTKDADQVYLLAHSM